MLYKSQFHPKKDPYDSYAAFQAGFWARKSRLQTTTHDFVAFQASHAKLPERRELW